MDHLSVPGAFSYATFKENKADQAPPNTEEDAKCRPETNGNTSMDTSKSEVGRKAPHSSCVHFIPPK